MANDNFTNIDYNSLSPEEQFRQLQDWREQGLSANEIMFKTGRLQSQYDATKQKEAEVKQAVAERKQQSADMMNDRFVDTTQQNFRNIIDPTMADAFAATREQTGSGAWAQQLKNLDFAAYEPNTQEVDKFYKDLKDENSTIRKEAAELNISDDRLQELANASHGNEAWLRDLIKREPTIEDADIIMSEASFGQALTAGAAVDALDFSALVMLDKLAGKQAWDVTKKIGGMVFKKVPLVGQIQSANAAMKNYNRIENTMTKLNRGKKLLVATGKYGTIGAAFGYAHTLADDLGNTRNYTFGDYATNMAIEGGIAGVLGGAFSGGLRELFRPGTPKRVYENRTVAKQKEDGSVETFTEKRLVEDKNYKSSDIPEETSSTPNGDRNVINEQDIILAKKNGMANDAMLARDVNPSNKQVQDGLNSHKRDMEQKKANIDKQIHNLEISIKHQEQMITEVEKTVWIETQGPKDPVTGKRVDAKKTKKLKSEKTVEGYKKKLNDSKKVNTKSTKDVERFIKETNNKIGAFLGTSFDIKKAGVKAVMEKIGDNTALAAEFELAKTAQNLLNHNKAKAKVKADEDAIKKTIDEKTAAPKAEVQKLKVKLDKLKNKNVKYIEVIKHVDGQMDELKKHADDVEIDFTSERLNKFMDNYNKGKIVDIHPRNLARIKAMAEETNNKEVLAALDEMDMGAVPEQGKVGDYTPEQLAELADEIEGSDLNNFEDNKSLFRGLAGIGHQMQKSKYPAVQRVGNLLRNNIPDFKDKSTMTNSAFDHKERFFDKYSYQISAIFKDNFNSWTDEVSKTRWSTRSQGYQVTTEYEEFTRLVGEAGAILNSKGSLKDPKFTPAVIKAVNEVKATKLSMAEDLAAANPKLTSKEISEMIDKMQDSWMPRRRRDDGYLTYSQWFEEEQNYEVIRGAYTKAVPTKELNGIKESIKERATKSEADEKLINELEEKIKFYDEHKKNGTLTDDHVRDIMAEVDVLTDGKGYSKSIAKGFWDNQYKRSTNGEVSKFNSTDLENAEKLLERFGYKISDEEKDLLKVLSEHDVDTTNSGANPFMHRMDMDLTYVNEKVMSRDGQFKDMKAMDLFDLDAEAALNSDLSKYSGVYGLRKSGKFDNFEDFDKFIEEQIKEVQEQSSLLDRERGNREIEKIRQTQQYFKGERHYDSSGLMWSLTRSLKNIMAGSKLIALPFAMIPEAYRMVSDNGLRYTFKNFPTVLKLSRDITSGKIRENRDFLSMLVNMNGPTLNPLMNIMKAHDSEFHMSTGMSKNKWEEAVKNLERKTYGFARVMNSVNYRVDATLRLMNLQSQTLGLLNSKNLRSQRFKDHGVTDEMAKFIEDLQNSKFVKKDARGDIVEIDYQGLMDTSREARVMVEDTMASVLRLADRSIQTARFAELPPWINTKWFSFFGQFKTFMIQSLGNQFAYNVTRFSSVTVHALTGQFVLSYLSNMARARVTYANDDEKFEEAMSNMGLSTFRSMAMTSAAMTMAQGPLTLFGLDVSGGSRTGQGLMPLHLKSVIDMGVGMGTSISKTITGGSPSEYDINRSLALFPSMISGNVSRATGLGSGEKSEAFSAITDFVQ